MSGRLFLIVGPSGAGKDTLIEGALARDPKLAKVRRVITRPSEAGGEDFEGVPEAEFDTRIAAGTFALYWSAHGLRYGIPASELAPLQENKDILLNASRTMLATAARTWPEIVVLHVTAPADVLAHRLAARGRESEDDILRRIHRADHQFPEGLNVLTVSNDATPDEGIARFLAAIQAARA